MDVPPAGVELLEEVHDMTHHGFHSLATLSVEVVNDSWTRRSLVGEKEMISWASMKKGYRANAHSHPHEQFIWVLAGAMEIRLGAETRICAKGDMVLIAPNLEHETVCIEDTEFVTMLAPPRADLLPGTLPDYER